MVVAGCPSDTDGLKKEDTTMDREELLVLCERFVRRRTAGLAGAQGTLDGGRPAPVWEIVDSYHAGNISESEKNCLLAYVSDPDEEEVAGCIEGCPGSEW